VSEVVAVVVTYNAEDLIVACLDAIGRLDVSLVAVVDNASTDQTLAVLERVGAARDGMAQKLRVTPSGVNLGFGRAVNAAAARVSCDDLLLVNPDCILPDETYRRMVTFLAQNPDVSAVAPGMVDAAGKRGIAGGAKPTLVKEALAVLHLDAVVPRRLRPALGRRLQGRRFCRRLTPYLATLGANGPVTLDWLSGFCLLVRMTSWREVGGFDPAYFLYYEDVDLCERLRRAGGRVVCLSDVAAIHGGSVSTKRIGKGRVLRGGMRLYFEKSGTAVEQSLLRLVGAGR
jgi:N-acetylglucosaminyl-diphospho-decaprenol L-rhamnosyltransferase